MLFQEILQNSANIASLSSVLTIAVVLLVLFMLTKMMQRQEKIGEMQYMAIKNSYAQLDILRKKFDEELYSLNRTFMANEKRWQDVNHIVTSIARSSNDSSYAPFAIDIKNHLFLKNLGITNINLEVDKELVFLLMPFHASFRPQYLSIRDACNDIGLKCFRGDERQVDDIMREFVSRILQARIVVALIDGRNPNVFFELGIAYAFDKTVIIASEKPTGTITDISMKRMIFYNSMDELYSKMKDEIGKALVFQDTRNSKL